MKKGSLMHATIACIKQLGYALTFAEYFWDSGPNMKSPPHIIHYIEISTHTPICNWEGSNYALGNSRESFNSGNFVELCPRKFQDQKPRPMEFAHEFFYITPGNSTSHLIDTWNFHMLFLQYPWKIQVFIQPACFDFLGE